jgi:hypothetical protein
LIECESARGILLDPSASLIHAAEPRAAIRNAGVARAFEERGCLRLVAQHVFAGEQARREVVARGGITRLARTPPLPRLLATGVTAEQQAGEEHSVASPGLDFHQMTGTPT